MPTQARPLRAVVCDPDFVSQAALAHSLQTAGFEVLERVDNGPRAITAAETAHPTLLVVNNELSGMLGVEVFEVVQRLALAEPPEMILVSADPAIRDRALDAGAWAVVPRGDVEILERVLAEVREFLETGERRTSSDRRAGEDRRQHQDWSKVISERRSGEDRRDADRRTDGSDAIDDLTD